MTRDTKSYATDNATRMEAWLQSHLNLFALVVVATGFLVQARIASGTYLNPDEALHFAIANQSSVLRTYLDSRYNAHPPLFFLLLHFWRLVAPTEFALRLLSVLAGTASFWVAFKWLSRAFGSTVALIGLMLLAFSPTMVSLSAEVRGYAVFLLFLLCALYFLECSLDEHSASKMVLFSLFLYLAILTHYSMLWVTMALGIYVLVRILYGQLPQKVLRVWFRSQAGVVVLYAFLYVTHILELRGSATEHAMRDIWFRPLYFHSGEDRLLPFLAKGSIGAFEYLFGSHSAGLIMLVFFLFGITVLLTKGLTNKELQTGRRDLGLGLLLLLPFLIVCCAAISGQYPYGGTRHIIFLAPFATAGISVLLVRMLGKQPLLALLAAAIIVFGLNLNTGATLPGQFFHPENQRRELMSSAIGLIRQSVPPGGLLFTDFQTTVLLGYYLADEQVSRPDKSHPGFLEFTYGGYRVVSVDAWMFTAEDFAAQFERMARAYGLKPGEQVWVVQAGWGVNLHTELPGRFPEFKCLAPQGFGENIGVFQLTVGPTSSPTAPTAVC